MGPKRNYSRRGQSLMAIFVLLMVLIGVLALTLDLGFVLLSRRGPSEGASHVGNGNHHAISVR